MSSHVKETVQAHKAEVAITDYFIVDPGTSEDQVKLSVIDSKAYGIAQVKQQLNAPEIGDLCEVAVFGGAYVKLGATVVKGDSLMPNNDSKAIKATSGKWAVAVADQGGDAGDIIGCRIFIHQLA